nr:MAG TPA: DNA-directed RNA polymerase [Bacteriophage sp.]
MAEYIDRETLLAHLRKCKETSTGSGLIAAVITAIQSFVEGMPLADVAPVVYGRWTHLGGDEWCCPVCGFVITTEGSWDKPTKKYCEDCGAKMDGKGEDDGQKD